ncbi:hypothetical protein [Variovorax sp.]|jgi:hypothetical protein|uniref:hypothetical protein n=1 Tax=Variovorax sp. TaxID=1871043 RepID=UPI0037D9B697
MEKAKVTVGFAPKSYISHCVVLSVPSASDGPLCVLHEFRWRGRDLMDQVRQVVGLSQLYDVTHIGVDDSELGRVALQMLRMSIPAVKVTDRREAEMSDAYLSALVLDRHPRLCSASARSTW